jgi:hypothetical protein
MSIDGLDFVMRRFDGGRIPELDMTGDEPAFAAVIVDEATLAVLAECCRTSAQNPRVADQLFELGVLGERNDNRPSDDRRLRAVPA